jgi:hypothetical protein
MITQASELHEWKMGITPFDCPLITDRQGIAHSLPERGQEWSATSLSVYGASLEADAFLARP